METTIIERLHQQTENTRKAILAYESGKKNDYWNAPTACMKAIAEYGAENIFMFGSGYRSGYHDDYASFTYYNNMTGEEFDDQWSTAFACPAYGAYECMTFTEAMKNGLVNMEKYLLLIKKRIRQMIDLVREDRMLQLDDLIRYKLPVKAEGGRKWQGCGYVVSKYQSSYGRYTTTYAVVYDTEHNQLREVNPDYLQVIGYAAIVNQWKREMNERVDAATAFDLHVNDRGEVHYDFYLTFEKWLEEQSRDVVIDTKGAAYPEQEARDKKRQDFKTKKMAELVDWVMANTDKKGTEITVLAERIYQRRYA